MRGESQGDRADKVRWTLGPGKGWKFYFNDE